MMDISNKSLALILVASILISAGGTLTAMLKLDQLRSVGVVTGQVTGAGQGDVNVSVESQVVVTAIGATINFGGGFANGSTCRLNSTSGGLATGNCTTFRDANDSIVVRNDGNNNITVNVSFSDNNASWIGGTNPGVWFEVFNNETGSCPNGTRFFGVTNWTALPATAAASVRVCQGAAAQGRLAFDDSKDQLSINIAVLIPSDADQDTSSGDNLTITITGSDADKDPTA